ncbi:MAG: PilN domain-containing protein [Planctomycetota bacterium]|jgi:Tfp pilus assembly protein PilN
MSTINLLPKNYVERRLEHRANMVCLVLFFVVMGGIGMAAMLSQRNTNEITQINKHVDEQYAQAAKKIARMQQLKAQKRESIVRAKATADLLERVPRSYVLAVLTQALPRNASLLEIKLIPKRRIADAPVKKKGSKFAAVQKSNTPPPEVIAVEVTGQAATDVEVAGFITNLLKSPLFSGVDLGYTEDKELKNNQRTKKDEPPDRVREFKIVMELKSDIDVIDLVEKDPKELAGLGEPKHPAAIVADTKSRRSEDSERANL